ncbi:MAG: UDP binding domain-containing protein, partial [Candidatus Kapaibacterium sp.]
YACAEGADALIVVTEWNEFRKPDFAKIATAMNRRIIFDGRNIYDREDMGREGFEYYSVGRPDVIPS